MIVQIEQSQRKGKGIAGAAIMLELMRRGIYQPQDCVGNGSLYIEGYRRVKSSFLVELMTEMAERGLSGICIWFQEADKFFPPRLWHRAEQTFALIGVQQDEHLGNTLVFDSHLRGVDVLLDVSSQIVVIPKYRPALDCVSLRVLRAHDYKPHFGMRINHVSRLVLPYYNSYEPIV